MRRHLPSIAFFVGGFLTAAVVIQAAYAQNPTKKAYDSPDGGIAVSGYEGAVIVHQGNKLYQVPNGAFDQKNVRVVELK